MSERDRPSPAFVRSLSHEFGLRSHLEAGWALQPIELVPEGGSPVLLLEDPGGEPLERLLGEPMPVGRFLRLAIAMAGALGRLHGCGLVHKDFKPANLFVQSDAQVRLTGFGIASRLPRHRQEPDAPEIIAGTLAYMAPEQTGRMNRSIDSRSDLYALGVTLYRMLTGVLPFTASDPMGWVHAHIAKRPVDPGERVDAPAALAAVVMKLLAKTPEERYQTAAGVERDLRRCLAGWDASGRIEEFEPGRQDIPDRLLIPEKLYGRESEVEILLAAFDRSVHGGAPELVLVSGYSGIGKSAVVNELHKVLVPPRGIFASGKFDQYKRDIPYSTLAQAFQSLIRRLLATKEADLAPWRDALREALGPNGRLMTELVPELVLIIGEQPPVPELPPQQAQSRFQIVFRRFIGVFARPEHPLALALDDLQWLDAATLDLMEDLLTRSNLQHLLLIGAYRDNEVNAAHPLVRRLEAIREAGVKVHEIRLAALARKDLGQLLQDALLCDAGRAAPLADLLHEKTAGNPFFAIQFLSDLAEEGLVAFDHGQGCWSWDPARIHAKGYTANVVDLMVGKLERLPAASKATLQQMACLGNWARTRSIALACGNSEEQVDSDLWDAVRMELIDRVDGAHKFVHDRVHEAAYGLIAVPERAAAHLRIGRLLLAATPPEALEDAVFDIVNHFNRGAALVDREERARVATLNVVAGKRAKRATAYASARNYLAQAAAFAPSDAWAASYESTFEMNLLLSECEYLSGNFEEADGLFDMILAQSRSDLDSAKVHSLRIKLYQVAGRYDEALAVGLRALRPFGVIFPETEQDIEAAVRKQFAQLPVHLAGRRIGELLDAPVAANPVTHAVIDLLVESVPCAYIARPPMFPLVTLEAVNRSILEGNTEQSSFAYGVLSLWLVSVPDIHAAYEFSEFSLRLNDRFDNRRLRGTLLHLHGDHVNHWRRHFATNLPILEQAFTACLEVGDLVYAGFLAFETVWQLVENGDGLEEVLAASRRFAAFTQQSRNRAIFETIRLEQRFVETLLGASRDCVPAGAGDDVQAGLDVIAQAAFGTGTAFHHVIELVLGFLGGRHEDAARAAEKAEPLLAAIMAMPMEATFHYFHALTLAALHPGLPNAGQAECLGRIEVARGKLAMYAMHCPENFANRLALVDAELARLQGRELQAERLYEEAIRSAGANGFVHFQAIAYEAAARFHAGRGMAEFGTLYMRNARNGYMRWGAAAKVRQLDDLHPGVREEGQPLSPDSTIGTPVEHLDLATVMKVSQAVSGEMVLEKLLDTLMHAAIEHAGAERALLVLMQGNTQRVAAEATTSGESVLVKLRDDAVAEVALPQSVFHFVHRTQENVILDDASMQGPFASDPYIREHKARSVLCMPLLNRGKLIGVLYLENRLAPRVFAPARIAVLKLLASEAAVSLENTRLYGDLADREFRIRRLVDANIIGIFIWELSGRIIDANDAFLQMVGYHRGDLASGAVGWTGLTPPEWRDRDVRELVPVLKDSGTLQPYEKEFFRKDGSRVPVLIGAATFRDGGNEGVAFVLDLTERKRSESEARERERRYHQMEMRLSDANRIASIGQLSASIAHELNQPLAGIVTNASTCLRRLAADPADVPGATEIAHRLIRDANRASDVIMRVRALFARSEGSADWVDLNEAAREMVALSSSGLQHDGVFLRCEFDANLPRVRGDRVQLQQVIMNLLRNAADAMRNVGKSPRTLAIRTQCDGADRVRLTVEDTGVGLGDQGPEKLFEAFYTTKAGGMGIGLSVSRSIVEGHCGRIWAEPGDGSGARFSFSIPVQPPAGVTTGGEMPPLIVDRTASGAAGANASIARGTDPLAG
ncbi:MAG TPA: AAA family ATPase [Ramlibacter sp.]|nr:AAA family ATPase [Ramlibacter sp.]